jgi:hypothetical protein
MRKNTNVWLLIVLTIMVSVNATVSRAQEGGSPKTPEQPKPLPAYHLDFALNELENGKKINTRQYAMNMIAGRQEDSPYFREIAFRTREIKIGTRIPIESEQGKLEYMDIGTRITCKAVEGEAGLALDVHAEVSSLVNRSDADKNIPSGRNPVLRQLSIDVSSAVTPGKLTSLGTVADPDSKREFQLEVTVTKLR